MDVSIVTLLGHKDHGKSTLIGNLMIKTGSVTEERIREAHKISSRLGKPFEPAFILDSFSEERAEGLTIDTTRGDIMYRGRAFEFIDVPGHEELIKNMIGGASYANVGLLVVSAKGEEGIKPQTKRHLFIARMIGIDRLIIAINKIDLAGYDKTTFENMKVELTKFIKRIGFELGSFTFVPISAYDGDNLTERSQNVGWYRGSTLMDAIYDYSTAEEKQPRNAPLRILVQGMVDKKSRLVAGRVISGAVSVGDTVTMLPVGKGRSVVKEIVANRRKVRTAKAGASIALKLAGLPGGNLRGSVISGTKDLPEVSNALDALVFVTETLQKGIHVRINGLDLKCRSIKILKNIDTTTGKGYKSRKAERLDAIEAEIRLEKKVAVESFTRIKDLGRFVLYSGGEFAGIGIVE